MPSGVITAAELRSAAFGGWFLVLTVCAFAASIVLLVLDWADAVPAGTGNTAMAVMAAWFGAVLVRAYRVRRRAATRHPSSAESPGSCRITGVPAHGSR